MFIIASVATAFPSEVSPRARNEDRTRDASKLVHDRVNLHAHTATSRDLVEIAKSDHIAFKKRLTDALIGRVEWKAANVPDEHSCRLGKWYDSVAEPQILDQSAYRELREPHAALHVAARAALSANESGDRKGALEGLERFVGAAKQVVSLLDAIGGELDRGAGVARHNLGDAASK